MDDGSPSTADQITGSLFVLVAGSEPEFEAVAVGSPQLAEYQSPLVVDSLADGCCSYSVSERRSLIFVSMTGQGIILCSGST